MPITKEEFSKGRLITQAEKEVEKFLRSHPEQAFTTPEIMKGLGYATGTNVWSDLLVFLGIQGVLKTLIEETKVTSRQIAGQPYYTWTK